MIRNSNQRKGKEHISIVRSMTKLFTEETDNAIASSVSKTQTHTHTYERYKEFQFHDYQKSVQ